jgi:hypothetical protein
MMPYDRPKTRADHCYDHYERLREILRNVEAHCYDGECRQLPNANEFRFLAAEVALPANKSRAVNNRTGAGIAGQTVW